MRYARHTTRGRPFAALAALVLVFAARGIHAVDPTTAVSTSQTKQATVAVVPQPSSSTAGGQQSTQSSSSSSRPWVWDWRTIVALISSVLISLVIAPGGSGGAQLYYPLFNVLLGFSIRDTAAIVSFVMFLGAIMSCSMAVAERHPTDPETRPLIDYGSVLIVAPAVLLGVAFGVIANAIVPLWLLQAASISVFSWAFIKIMLPYLALRAKEKQRDKAAAAIAGDLRRVAIVAHEGPDVEAPASHDATALSTDDMALVIGQPRPGSTTLAALEKCGDAALVRAAAAALVADTLSRRATGGSDLTAEDLQAFCDIDAEVRALEAAALDDYPIPNGASGMFTRDPDTLMMIVALDDAAGAGGLSGAAVTAAGRLAESLRVASLVSMHSSVGPTPGVKVALGQQGGGINDLAADDAAAAACADTGSSAKAAGGHLPEDPAAAATEPGGSCGGLPTKAAALLARWRRWAARQPVLLMVLTLGVLAQQILFSILQRAVVKACTDGFYALLGVRVAVTVVIAVGVSVVVMRHNRAEAAAAMEGQQRRMPSIVVEKPAEKAGEGGKQEAARLARSARKTAREAKHRRNWESIQWGVTDIIEKNFVMLLIGVLGGCLGLGGGFAIAPLLLAMGLHPQCQAGTSKAILFISTFASSVSFLIAGRMPFAFALVFGLINLLVTPIGVIVVNYIIKRTGRPSLLVALNALSYGAGVVLLLAMSGIPGWISTAQGRVPAGFQMQNLCSGSN